jgi:hypothetical protein
MRTYERILPSETITRLVCHELIGQWFTCEPLPDGHCQITVKAEYELPLREIIKRVVDGHADTMVVTVQHKANKFIIGYAHSDCRSANATVPGLARTFMRECTRYFGTDGMPPVDDPESDKIFPAE